MGTFGVKYTEIYVPSMRYENMRYENMRSENVTVL